MMTIFTRPYLTFIFLGAIVCLLGCKSQDTESVEKKNLELHFVRNVNLPLPKSGMHIQDLHYYEEKGEPYLACLLAFDPYHIEFALYALKTQQLVLHNPLEKLAGKNMFSFKYLGSDSLFVFITPSYNGFVHDSSLLQINDKGEIIQDYPLYGAPVWTSINHQTPKDSARFIDLSGNGDGIVYKDRRLILPLNLVNNLSYIDKPKARLPMSGDYDLASNRYIEHPIYFPTYVFNHLWPYEVSNIIESSGLHPHEVVYGFGMSSQWISYDLRNRQATTHYLPTCLFDSVRTATRPYPTKIHRYAQNIGYYSSILPDKWRNHYIRKMIFKDPIDKTHLYGYDSPRIGIQLVNPDFQVIAEGMLPDSLGIYPQTTTPEGLLCSNFGDRDADTLHFKVYRFNAGKNKCCIDKLNVHATPSPKEENQMGYLQKFHPLACVSPHTMVIPIFTQNSCHPCIKELFAHLNQMTPNQQKKIAIVLMSDNDATLQHYLSKITLPENVSIYKDTNRNYKGFFSPFFNAQLWMISNQKILKTIQMTAVNEAYFIQEVLDHAKK